MDSPPLPPGVPAPPKRGLSTGCIVAIVLVVVGIIGILGLLVIAAIPTYQKVIAKAHIIQAKAVETLLNGGLEGYQSEYGKFPPLPAAAQNESAPLRSRGPIIVALLGKDPNLNARGISFATFPAARHHKFGYEMVDGEPAVLDPWGEPYYILLDWKGDGKIPDPEHPGSFISATVLVYSSGPDHDPATWADNVASWK